MATAIGLFQHRGAPRSRRAFRQTGHISHFVIPGRRAGAAWKFMPLKAAAASARSRKRRLRYDARDFALGDRPCDLRPSACPFRIGVRRPDVFRARVACPSRIAAHRVNACRGSLVGCARSSLALQVPIVDSAEHVIVPSLAERCKCRVSEGQRLQISLRGAILYISKAEAANFAKICIISFAIFPTLLRRMKS